MKQEFLKPGEGRAPRHPVSNRRIAIDGEKLDVTADVMRMKNCGDLVKAKPRKPVATPSKSKGAK